MMTMETVVHSVCASHCSRSRTRMNSFSFNYFIKSGHFVKEKQDGGSRKGELTFVLEDDMGLNLSSASN